MRYAFQKFMVSGIWLAFVSIWLGFEIIPRLASGELSISKALIVTTMMYGFWLPLLWLYIKSPRL